MWEQKTVILSGAEVGQVGEVQSKDLIFLRCVESWRGSEIWAAKV
jgi:hypothetical protein